MRVWLAAIAVLLCGCAHYLTMDDPKLQPFAGMYQIDRAQYGIGPLPKEAKVRIFNDEWKKSGYDAMVQIYDEKTGTSHHIAFRRAGGSFVWIGESEECYGPTRYKTVDGTFNEELVVAYFHGVRNQLEGLNIYYSGPDRDLSMNKHITVAEASAIRAKWHCDSNN